MKALNCNQRVGAGCAREGAHVRAPWSRRRALSVVASHQTGAVAASTVVTTTSQSNTVQANSTSTDRDVKELDPKTFYDFIAGDNLCVVDYYTDWCGPCQVMHKEVDKLTAAFKGVKFAKLNCGNCEEFSTRQRIRALPTFRLYYKGTCLDEVTGAKPMQLRQLLTHYLCMVSIS